MLNTALHNPNAKMKITADMFVKQNKGINSGKDLPADMLEAIFRSASCICKGTVSRAVLRIRDVYPGSRLIFILPGSNNSNKKGGRKN
jgi:hypothetical protein